MPTARKYTHCRCGKPLPQLKGSRKGRLYKFCSTACRDEHASERWHRFYRDSVKATKAARRDSLQAVGFPAIERT